MNIAKYLAKWSLSHLGILTCDLQSKPKIFGGGVSLKDISHFISNICNCISFKALPFHFNINAINAKYERNT